VPLWTHVRDGAARYRALLTLPGARGPVTASVLGCMPIGMFSLAILLLARDATGSFAQAGRVAGAFGLANALGAVAQGRLMDRVGQTRVLRTAAAVHPLALVALVVIALDDGSVAVMALAAAAGGASLPQTPAAMRSLWGDLVADPEQRQTAYALVSIVFEVSVMTAPALVALIAAVASPAAAVLVAAALCTAGGWSFAATRGSQRWRGESHDIGWLGPLQAGGMRALVAVLCAFGLAFGIVQVAVPAFAAERGSAETGGVLLAALSAGSLAGGLLYGARTWPGTPRTRLPALLLMIGAMFALLAVAPSQIALAALLVAAGLVFAPTTVVGSTLLDTVAPEGTVTEAFAAMVMGIVAGTALGNALGGTLIDGASYDASVLAAGAIAAAGSALALTRRGTLDRPRVVETRRRSVA
jgi:MFS family permease